MPPILIPYQLSEAAVALIVKGLRKLPHEEVDELLHFIIDEANKVMNPPAVKRVRKKKEPAPPAKG